jgi:hypothetical protein
MADTRTTRADRMSPVGGAAALIGVVLLAYGVSGLVFGGAGFDTDAGGTVNGETWLGVEGNGWTNVLFATAGALLILGASTDLGARAVAVLVGVAFAAAAVIAVIDGDDVFGVFAANGWTMLVWGVAAIVLLAVVALPGARGGRREEQTVAGPPRDPAQIESVERELQGTRQRPR